MFLVHTLALGKDFLKIETNTASKVQSNQIIWKHWNEQDRGKTLLKKLHSSY